MRRIAQSFWVAALFFRKVLTTTEGYGPPLYVSIWVVFFHIFVNVS
jgi:hypothetical protein